MDALKLSESEHKVYEELFQTCDLGKTAKIPKLIVGELLATSGLPTDVLLKIADMCGASRLGYFGRSQFYIALKLIAVAQQQLPLSFESFAANLPLPVFNLAVLNANLATYDPTVYSNPPEPQAPSTNIMNVPSGGVLPPPPTKKHVRNMSGTIQGAPIAPVQSHSNQVATTYIGQPNSSASVISMQSSSKAVNQVSSSNPTQAPSTTTHDPNTGWASFPSPAVNDTNFKSQQNQQQLQSSKSESSEEQLPSSPPAASTPGDDNDSNSLNRNAYGGSKKSFNLDTCSLSSADYATSEAESTDDIWSINDEQREYYVKQFLTMQSDLTSTIKGPKAKEFFEKSKLPTKELSKIWKLSDVNRDGALTLQEFCTAMHLVVLRRNDVELPSSLPPSLMPYTPASSEPFSADLGDEQADRSPSPLLHSQQKPSWPSEPAGFNRLGNGPNGQWRADVPANAGETWSSQEQSWQQTGSDNSGQWRASESSSPLQSQWTGSSISSPTHRPVNFDSALPGVDEIAHPVARKMSPTSKNDIMDRVEPKVEAERSNADNANFPYTRPRPVPKKVQSIPGNSDSASVHTSKHPLQSYHSVPSGPPTVPPRNQWPVTSPENALADPFSTNDSFNSQMTNFADFSLEFGKPSNEPFNAPTDNSYPAAGDVLHSSIQQPVMQPTVVAPTGPVQHQYSIRDKKEIQKSIQAQKERNAMLMRVNSELNQELQEVMEQRISLEIQLEHLKPC